MPTFAADLEQGSRTSDCTRSDLSENLQNDSCRAAYNPNDDAVRCCFPQNRNQDNVSIIMRGDSQYMEFGAAPGCCDVRVGGEAGINPALRNQTSAADTALSPSLLTVRVGGEAGINPALRANQGNNLQDVASLFGNTRYDSCCDDTSLLKQSELVRDGHDKPVLDREKFQEMLMNNIFKAYWKEGNSSRFWSTLQSGMSSDLQKLVDEGKISQADKQAFDKVFMNDARDVFRTHGNGSPAEFWKTLEDRVYNHMKMERELPRPPAPDDRPDVPPNPGPGDKTVEGARTKFRDAIDDHLSPERVQRLDKMMKEFEQRGAERVEALVAAGKDRATVEKEWNDKITKTYAELSELVTTNSSTAVYDTGTRAKLAENAMYLFMNPTKSNQGQHGTCWIESEINLIGMTNHPEKMASLLKQVATTGTYKDLEGKTYTVPKSLLSFSGEEANWTISNADNGLRSPVGALFDRTLSYMGGRMDGGTNGGYPQEAERLLKKVCGEGAQKMVQIRSNYLTESDIQRLNSPDLQKAMLEQGGVIVIGPGHMFAVKLVKNNGEWQIVSDNQWGARNDQLIGRVGDLRSWNVSSTRQQFVPDHGSMVISGDSPIGNRSMSNSYQPYYYGGSNYGYGVCVTVVARGDYSNRVYDDTNKNIQGPWSGKDVDSCNPGGGAVVDSQFQRKRYEESLRQLELARKNLVIVGR